jgi:sugar transferase (PEP-CTERM/EpsH1 system associated)
LFLTHRAPFPPDRGDRIRSYHILKHLAERFQVYLGSLVDEPVSEQTASTLRALTVDHALAPLHRYGRWLRAAASVAKGQSATEGLFESPRLKAKVREWARTVRFDGVFAFCSSMVQYAQVPELADIPLVVDLVDVDSQKWLDYAARTSGMKRRLFALEADRVRRLERSLPGRARAILLVSEAEAELYRSFCPNRKTHAVMNGVDLDYFRDDFPVAEQRPNQCVFVGVLDYRANVDGLVWFCREVWPRVLARKPDATFAIVGKSPNATVRALGDLPGVRLVGPVADVRPYIAESRFVVAPLLVARGIQNKVLEAMAMGKPVVATRQALEGLDVESGKHAAQARDAAEWSQTIDELLADDEKCRALGEAANHHVKVNHAWTASLAALNACCLPPDSRGRKPAPRQLVSVGAAN